MEGVMKRTFIFGNIHTLDPLHPTAEAIGIQNGKIFYCGNRSAADLGPKDRILDFHEQTILPGFIDTHVHVIPSGIFMNSANLSGADNIAEVLSCIRKHAEETPKKGWVLAAFFQDKLIEEKRFPTRQELDAVSSEKPILICHNDLHPIALNSKALALLNVDPKKDGVRTDEAGRLTGIIEDPACVDMLGDILAKLGIANIYDGIVRVDDYAVSHGVTTVFGKDVLDILTLIGITKDLLKAEYVPMWYSNGCKDLESIRKIAKNKRLAGRVCVCAFADGAFDGHSAATAEPYTDRPDTCGILNYTDDEMYAFTAEAVKLGLQVSFHAIGDAAIDQVLRVYERVLNDYPKEDHRLRIEHFEEPTKEAIEKAGRLHVALGMQPLLIEVCERMDFSGYAPFIGDRVRRCSPYRSILDAGILVGGGTDYTVTPMEVLHGAQVLMTHPVESERISLQECLEMNTVNAAKLGFLENQKGCLKPGMDADFIVTDRDPYQVTTEELSDIRIMKTFRSGRKVYDRDAFLPTRKRSLAVVLMNVALKKVGSLFRIRN